jgi:hypothetical protein
MKMSPGSLVLIGLILAAPVLAQGPPAVSPGAQSQAQGGPQPGASGRPGLPPRDPVATAPVTGTAVLRGRVVSPAGTGLVDLGRGRPSGRP